MFKLAITLSLVFTTAFCMEACTKGAKVEDNANASQANRSTQAAATAPLLQQTLRGDIERVILNISTARESFKNNKSHEAEGQLQGAKQEIDAALGRNPRLREEWEALKAAIDRTIGAIQRRDKDADSQLAELQVRIGAIKTNTP